MVSSAPAGAVPACTVSLAYDQRRKTRQLLTLEDGTELALLLPRGTVLQHGSLLAADDGRLFRVEAAPPPVLVITAAPDDRLTLTRAAYHLGNRHTPVQVGPDYLRIELDPVLQDLVVRLGAHVEQQLLPFEPEPGAYGGGHRHGHEESFAEDYALAHSLFHEHASPPADHPHPSCPE